MLREPSPTAYQFDTITLDELVPEDYLVCKIDATIDFDFIRDAVAHLYCPYRFMKMQPIGKTFDTA